MRAGGGAAGSADGRAGGLRERRRFPELCPPRRYFEYMFGRSRWRKPYRASPSAQGELSQLQVVIASSEPGCDSFPHLASNEACEYGGGVVRLNGQCRSQTVIYFLFTGNNRLTEARKDTAAHTWSRCCETQTMPSHDMVFDLLRMKCWVKEQLSFFTCILQCYKNAFILSTDTRQD